MRDKKIHTFLSPRKEIKMRNKNFFMLPNRIFSLGLKPKEFTVYCCLGLFTFFHLLWYNIHVTEHKAHSDQSASALKEAVF